ncbi:hypothetical protein Q428_00345 [Fervidicella metallireducens AeB]|uniref:LysM domain-containing protein n=1 Tax=Fervidicella metallireducens AeB TaxID=1403537 RepID=A0A017RZ54_9CLOT|nr:SPOCS domain-containing protein [Fervidicella metallireducens]EYE89871.1 hypothetical protein Q428_00345 [Fervidicella metallireducens AeB]
MPVEIVRDMINYEKLVGEGSSQTIVKGDIVLEDRNPDMERILCMDGKAKIVSSEVMEDKVIVEGKVNFEIYYTTMDENNEVYKKTASSNFSHTIQVPGTTPKSYCKAVADIEHMDFEQVNSKKVNVSAVINIRAAAYDMDVVEAVSDIRGDNVQLLKDSVEVDEHIGHGSGQSIIKGKIQLPEDMPEVKSILKPNVHVHKKDIIVQDGKVIINACALIKVMFITTEQHLMNMEQDVAFTHELNIPEVKTSMKCDARFDIEDIYEDITENENGERKNIDIEAVIGINANVYMNREIQTIVDAYSPEERYEIERRSIKSIGFYAEGTDSQTLKERIILPENAEGIDKIKTMMVKPSITDLSIIEDKLLIEGVVNCCSIYMAANQEGGVFCYEEEIPFKASIDMPGTKIDMMPEATVNIEHVSFEKISPREIEVKVILECEGKVYRKSFVDVVKSVQETELPENIKNMPSLIIYNVQPNDTLWKIAKKYNTAMEDILKINDIPDPDEIQPGFKILIPNKRFIK